MNAGSTLPMKMNITLAAFAMALLLSCKTASLTEKYDYVCALHGEHHLRDRAQTAACFGITLADYDRHRFFGAEGDALSAEAREGVRNRLTDEVENVVVDLMFDKIQAAMGKALKKHWHFDRLHVPVVFREFASVSGNVHHIKIVAIMRQAQLEPAAIIKYLPLEYKMDLIDETGILDKP